MASAVVVFAGAELLAWPAQRFSMVNVAFVVAWLLLAGAIIRHNTAMWKLEVPDVDVEP